MFDEFIDEIVLVRLNEPEVHSGRTEFSARLVKEKDDLLIFENKRGVRWMLSMKNISELVSLRR